MQKGISIIGAVFTLLVLAIFGTAIVSLISTDQESRRMTIEKEQAFYEIQAGLEYAIREINYGGYPVQTNKVLGTGNFTTVIDFSQHKVTATGTAGDVSKTHSITYSPMGGDCLIINSAVVTLGGMGYTDVGGLIVRKNCLSAVSIDKIQLSWSPNGSETVKRIDLDNNILYDNPTGTANGGIIDVPDYTISDAVSHTFNLIRFSSDMRSKTVTIVIYLTDTSYTSGSFTLPAS